MSGTSTREVGLREGNDQGKSGLGKVFLGLTLLVADSKIARGVGPARSKVLRS